METAMLSVLITIRKYLFSDKFYFKLVKWYRLLSQYHLVIGSSQKDELQNSQIPKDYFKGMSSTQMREGIVQLDTFKDLLRMRKKNGDVYTNFLKKHDKAHVPRSLHKDHSFLCYPILVENRAHFQKLAKKAHIRLGDWFNSVIHPIQHNFHHWQIDPNSFPNADYISKHVVTLPTDTKHPEKILKYLEKNIAYLK